MAGLGEFTLGALWSRRGSWTFTAAWAWRWTRVRSWTRCFRHVAKANQVKASELLGISRTTLRAKLRALNLGVGQAALPRSGGVEFRVPRLGANP